MYPAVNQSENGRMLQNIRETLAGHQRDDLRKSVTPSPVTVRETPSPSAEQLARQKSRNSPGDPQRHHHAQMAQIRNSLKPHHRSDPGFNLPTDQVNGEMLQELIMKGYDQVCNIINYGCIYNYEKRKVQLLKLLLNVNSIKMYFAHPLCVSKCM